MTHIFLFHGAYGNPNENWFPWLRLQCTEFGCKVISPKFPTPENQSLTNWMKEFEKNMDYIDEKSILVGHSLGATFVLRVLEKLNKPVRACLLVAGFSEKLGNEKFDSINASFLKRKFDWEKIKKNCETFYVIYSDNDPYVPINVSSNLSHNLNAKGFLVRGGGHFNSEYGYDEIPIVLNRIKVELKK